MSDSTWLSSAWEGGQVLLQPCSRKPGTDPSHMAISPAVGDYLSEDKYDQLLFPWKRDVDLGKLTV